MIPPVTQEPLAHLDDATPNDGYVVRILRAHRAHCDVRWARTTGEEEMDDALLGMMNRDQAERARLLDAAIRVLESPHATHTLLFWEQP